MPKNYTEDVFPFINLSQSISISYTAKADLSEDHLQNISEAGVKTLTPGIEALATSTLKLMRKGTTAFQNVRFLKNCLMCGIQPLWNLLTEFPGDENAEEVYQKYLRDIPLLAHLPPPSGIFSIQFERGSHYFLNAESYNLDLHPADFYKKIYPFGEEVLKNIAFYFENRNGKPKSGLLDKLHKKAAWWQSLWHTESDQIPPRLFFKDNFLCDSRSGELVQYQVSDLGKSLLELMIKPKNKDKIATEFGDLADMDYEKEMAFLKERGLLFQEKDRVMSLVCTTGCISTRTAMRKPAKSFT